MLEPLDLGGRGLAERRVERVTPVQLGRVDEDRVRPVEKGAVADVAEEGEVAGDGDRLLVAGPEETIGRRVEAWIKRRALDLLSAETQEYAALAKVTVVSVAIGDARRRWGSCASTGVIRYSWRLVLAPGWVRRATVAHEVAHRVHMNHGPQFHALVADLYGRDPTPARVWLREHGAALHWVGRSS